MFSSLQNLLGITPSRPRSQSWSCSDTRRSPYAGASNALSPMSSTQRERDFQDSNEYPGSAGTGLGGTRNRQLQDSNGIPSLSPPNMARVGSGDADDTVYDDVGIPILDDDDESWFVPDRITSRNTEGLTLDETTARLFIAGWSFEDAHMLGVLIHKQRYSHRRLRALMQEIAFRIPNLSSGFLSAPVSQNYAVRSLSASSTAAAAAATSTVTDRRRNLSKSDRQESSTSISTAGSTSELSSLVITPEQASSDAHKMQSKNDESEPDSVNEVVAHLMPDIAFSAWFPSIAITAYTPCVDKPSMHPSATGFRSLELAADSITSIPRSLSSTESKTMEPSPSAHDKPLNELGLDLPAVTGLLTASSVTTSAIRHESVEGITFAAVGNDAEESPSRTESSLSENDNTEVDPAKFYSWDDVTKRIQRRELRRINASTLDSLQNKEDLDDMGADVLSLIPEFKKKVGGHESAAGTPKHHLHRSHLVQDGQAAKVRVDVFKAMRHGARVVRVGNKDFTPQTIRLSQDMRVLYWRVPDQNGPSCQRRIALPLPDPSDERALPLPLSPLLPSDSMEDTRDVCDSSDPRVRRIYYTFYKPQFERRSRQKAQGVLRPTPPPNISFFGYSQPNREPKISPSNSSPSRISPASSTATSSVTTVQLDSPVEYDLTPYGRGPKSILDPLKMASEDDRIFRNCRRIPIESITGISTFITHDPRFKNVRGKMPLTYGMIIYYEMPESVDDYAEEQKIQQHLLNTQPHLREYVKKAAESAAHAVAEATSHKLENTEEPAGLLSPSVQPVYEGSTLEFANLSQDTENKSYSIDDQVTAPIGSRPIQLKIVRKSIALIALDGNEYHVWLKGLAMLRSYYNMAPPEVITSFSSKIVWSTIERRWPSNLYLTDVEMGVSMDRAFDAMDVLETAGSSDGPKTLPPCTLRPPAPSFRILLNPVGGSTERNPSLLLTRPQLELLLGQVGKKAALLNWKRVFLLTNDGADLNLLLKRVANATHTFIIVRDASYRIFGGFGTAKWSPGLGYFGNSDSFVFRYVNPDASSLRHSPESSLEIYQWAGQIRFFQVSDDQGIGFGGGGGTAFHIDKALRSGKSEWSGTYQNPVLAATSTFSIYEVEAWVGIAP